jgi:hypothetical protein
MTFIPLQPVPVYTDPSSTVVLCLIISVVDAASLDNIPTGAAGTERRGEVITTPASRSVHPEFEYLPVD